jgi:hypothetical protein
LAITKPAIARIKIPQSHHNPKFSHASLVSRGSILDHFNCRQQSDKGDEIAKLKKVLIQPGAVSGSGACFIRFTGLTPNFVDPNEPTLENMD